MYYNIVHENNHQKYYWLFSDKRTYFGRQNGEQGSSQKGPSRVKRRTTTEVTYNEFIRPIVYSGVSGSGDPYKG